MAVGAALALGVVVALSGCGGGASSLEATAALRSQARAVTMAMASRCGSARTPPRRYRHVVWVVMENKAISQIVGAADAPFINALRSRCGSASQFFAEAHPSLANYIALTSGSTQGIADDAGPDAHKLNVASIFSQLGGGWRTLADSMPSACSPGDSGRYAVRHNAAVYYTNLAGACKALDVPLSSAPDLSARFTLVIPDLCHDMHDCGVAAGDAWLSTFLSEAFSSAAYRTRGTAIFVTWDESDGSSGNHVATIVIAPSIRPGTISPTRFTHYSMLRTTEDLLGLGFLGDAAGAPSMRATLNL